MCFSPKLNRCCYHQTQLVNFSNLQTPMWKGGGDTSLSFWSASVTCAIADPLRARCLAIRERLPINFVGDHFRRDLWPPDAILLVWFDFRIPASRWSSINPMTWWYCFSCLNIIAERASIRMRERHDATWPKAKVMDGRHTCPRNSIGIAMVAQVTN